MIESRLSFSLSDMAALPLRPSSSGPAPSSRPPMPPSGLSLLPPAPARLLGRPPRPAPPHPAGFPCPLPQLASASAGRHAGGGGS